MVLKLNLGCGRDYRKGWVNVDNNPQVKVDLKLDLNLRLPFPDSSVDIVLMDNFLEHISRDNYFKFLEEIWRVCKNGARIQIYVPHFSGMYSLKHPTHYNFFGIGSFDTLRPEPCFNGERYTNARFKLISERLIFFHHNLINSKLLSKLPINWIFNSGRSWHLLMERFNPFGFDEIYFELECFK